MTVHGGKVFCAIHFQTVITGKMKVKICMDGKNFVPSKSLSAVTSYKQWEDIEVPSHNDRMNELDEAKTYTKTVITTKNV